MSMHPRTCVSAISTFRLSLPEDLAFWANHGVTNVGVSVAKLEAFGWDEGAKLVAEAVANGLHVVDLIGLGPFHLARPERWGAQRDRLAHSIETARAVGASVVVFTTGPFAPLTWDEAADALDLARRLDTGVCMEVNACWAERDLASTIADGVDRIRLVQVSDFKVGTLASSQRLVPGDGDIPLARIIAAAESAGYTGSYELELIGDAITEEGYDRAVPRAVAALEALLPA